MMNRTVLVLALAFPLAACSSQDGGPSNTPAPKKEPARFVVHEWGTFTSVQASDGGVLEGMHHEDEVLPDFVYGRGTLAGNCDDCPKDLEIPPIGVTQKLETPVLYFHGEHIERVSVTVDFPKGVVSEWFPNASRFLPELGAPSIADGSMTWDAQLVPGMRGFPEIAADSVWAPSRNVDSVPIRIGDEYEQFIFYRGLGAFETPFSVHSDADGTLAIRNDSPETIPAVFLLRLHEPGGTIVPLGSLLPNSQKSDIIIPVGGKERIADYVQTASDTVRTALEADGLYSDEAQAMVDTWEHSYFNTPGLRILYVAPRAWSDALLPISVTPTPDELVRTMVGRVEVLTVADETDVVTRVETFAIEQGDPQQVLAQLGRFAEPKLRRALSMLTEPAARAACEQLIALATVAP